MTFWQRKEPCRIRSPSEIDRGFQIQSSFAPFINMRNFDCLPHVRPAPRNYLHTQRVSFSLSLGIYILSVPLRAERKSLGLRIDVIARLVYANSRDGYEWERHKNLADAERARSNFPLLLFFHNAIDSRKISSLFSILSIIQRFY